MSRDFRTHRYLPFVKELVKYSVNSNIDSAVLEWNILDIKRSAKFYTNCICGRDLKLCYYYKNKHNHNVIPVGKECINYFPGFVVPDDFVEYESDDDRYNNSEEYKYHPDNFAEEPEVVFDQPVYEDCKIENEDEVFEQSMYEDCKNEEPEDENVFEYEQILKRGKKESLVRWKPTLCSFETYSRLADKYGDSINSFSVFADKTVCITWRDSKVSNSDIH